MLVRANAALACVRYSYTLTSDVRKGYDDEILRLKATVASSEETERKEKKNLCHQAIITGAGKKIQLSLEYHHDIVHFL